MRNSFAKQITELAQKDSRVVLLAGDIGNRLFDNLKAKCPDRFFNCGVAEANMIGMAAGMAMSGLRPFCYTITPFVTYRCLEQIRVDVCYHHVPVVIVGTGSGLSYASLGATHHSCEEMGMLRTLPGLAVLAPADEMEVRAALKAALDYPHPVYIRIGKKGEPVVHKTEPQFVIGKAIVIREGTEVCLLSAGTLLPVAMEAGEILQAAGISTRVVSFHTLKPLDAVLLAEVFAKFKLVATIEEHSLIGGLGGAVAEWLADFRTESIGHGGAIGSDGGGTNWRADAGATARLLRFGTRDEFLHLTCEQEEAREYFGLTSDAIAARILQAGAQAPQILA